MLNRRQVIQLGVSTAVVPGVASDSRSTLRIIDTNVHLFRWPFRRLPLDETERLIRKMDSLGIVQAWAGNFEGVLHRDVSSVNSRLAERCSACQQLLPIGSINLSLPNWQEDLRSCFEKHRMHGVRIYPGYHGYTLDHPDFLDLLRRSADAARLVQIAVCMEDTRTQHPMMRVNDVDLSPLADVMSKVPGVRIQLLNGRLPAALLDGLGKLDGLYFDTARVESTDGVPKLVRQLPPGRVLLGTHSPCLIPEAALIRVHESNLLSEEELGSVLYENAERLLSEVKA